MSMATVETSRTKAGSNRPGQTAEQEAIAAMESTAVDFAARFINDARIREGYVAEARQYAGELRRQLSAGRLTPKQAAEAAQTVRNQLLDAARGKSADLGKSMAEFLK